MCNIKMPGKAGAAALRRKAQRRVRRPVKVALLRLAGKNLGRYNMTLLGASPCREKTSCFFWKGDRRTIGRADQVAAIVSEDLGLFPKLIAGLWSADPLVRMRAADATEKVTRKNRELLQPYKKELLGLMAEAKEQELRWHLAVMVPRLSLNANEQQSAISLLNKYLEDRSSIVKTFALQGLADLAQDEPSMCPRVIEISTRGHSKRYASDEGSQPQTADSVGTCLMVRTIRAVDGNQKTLWFRVHIDG